MSAPASEIRVLLVDDDDTFRRVLSGELTRRGYRVAAEANGASALARVAEDAVDVILLDLRLPDMDGIVVLERLQKMEASEGVIVLTGHGTIDTAIRAVRLGAADYLEKPCPIERMEMTIHRVHEQAGLRRRKRVLEDGYSPCDVGAEFLGRSQAFQKLCRDAARVAALPSAVLVQGETGTGKEMVAKLIHGKSPRRDEPFVIVDCAGLHEELLESELFGHEKGAFTGATRLKHGLFEVAHGGTIFLDEIGETSPNIQAKLLRVLETSRFRRVGGTKETASDVRVISATNCNLRDAIARGHFRQDLFFRLSTVTLEIPPLRDRREDVEVLLDHFTRRANDRFSLGKRLSPDAREVLLAYAWPGNVRELCHVIEHAMALAEGELVQVSDLPGPMRPPVADEGSPGVELVSLQEMERRHVMAVLDRLGGNRAQAAHALGISERNLYRLLKRYEPTGT